MNYVAPQIKLSPFTCPYCNTFAQQRWDETMLVENFDRYFTFTKNSGYKPEEVINVSTCQSCSKYHLWIGENMVVPNALNIPLPNSDMPEDITELYLEAREIFGKSPRASAALLRLGLQLLCQNLGGEGKNINSDIAKFVKDGLDVRVQKSLDIVRVTGNNAVHPGQLDMIDNTDIAARLFGLLNFIVDAMITQPKQIDSFFNELPQGAREAIEKRDV